MIDEIFPEFRPGCLVAIICISAVFIVGFIGGCLEHPKWRHGYHQDIELDEMHEGCPICEWWREKHAGDKLFLMRELKREMRKARTEVAK